jgi:16S rRNA (cytosine1402-N4)-methyltransferase
MLHAPVLRQESLELLAIAAGGFYVDGTVGMGGHAVEILTRSGPSGRLLGVDRDAEALAVARERLAVFGDRVSLRHADYRQLPELLGGEAVDGVLLDLGVSSLQLDRPERGFSFQREGPLDMRMDQSQGETAADLVNGLSEQELADLIFRYGEERASRRIARAVTQARKQAAIETTLELATLVRRAAGGRRRGRIDPATRTFQALRIAVNSELEGLSDGLRALAACLKPGGRLVVIAFHSLEDREVKLTFRDLGRQGFRLLTKKPVRPSEDELRANPRARSARLRALEKAA